MQYNFQGDSLGLKKSSAASVTVDFEPCCGDKRKVGQTCNQPCLLNGKDDAVSRCVARGQHPVAICVSPVKSTFKYEPHSGLLSVQWKWDNTDK